MSDQNTIEEQEARDYEEYQELMQTFFPKPKTYHLVEIIFDIFLYAVIIKILLRIWMWV